MKQTQSSVVTTYFKKTLFLDRSPRLSPWQRLKRKAASIWPLRPVIHTTLSHS